MTTQVAGTQPGQGGAVAANGQQMTPQQWAATPPDQQAAWQAYWAQQRAMQAAATSAIAAGAPAAPPMLTLPGVTVASDKDLISPMLSVCSKAKIGKSRSIITSLVDWPKPGMHPLVIAVDDDGPMSCLDVGYFPHRLRLREEDYPGLSFDQAIIMSLAKLHAARNMLHQQYGSIVVDCGSTLGMKLHAAAQRLPKNARNPNMQAPFFELRVWFQQVIGLVRDLGLPNIWLSWSTDGYVEPANQEQKKPARQFPGGPDILGAKLRNVFSGMPSHNFYMEKRKVGVGGRDYDTGLPGDELGYVRLLHSQPYDNMDAGGRLQRFLRPIMPANMGYILSCITGKGPYATGAR